MTDTKTIKQKRMHIRLDSPSKQKLEVAAAPYVQRVCRKHPMRRFANMNPLS